MVNKIINDWLEEGFLVSKEAKHEIRRENTYIPILTNEKGIIQTPKPLFTTYLEETKLDPHFLPQHLASIENKFRRKASICLDKYILETKNDQKSEKQEDFDVQNALIEYDRKSIFLSRVMFNLFEMPDSSVAKISPQYWKVVEKNDLYQTALERHQKFPDNFKEQCLQTDFIDSTEKQIETNPMVSENKNCMVNKYLMIKHYNRSEMKVKPPPKTFKEFCKSKTKFRDFEELISNIGNYPEILNRLQKALYITEKTLNYNTFKNSVLEYNDCRINFPNDDHAVQESNEESGNDIKLEPAEKFDIKLHLGFHFEKVEKYYRVTCVECSPINPSIFVAGYGVSRFKEMDHDPRGMILCWNIHKCGYPEKIYFTEESVTCLEFSKSEPYLVAVGMRYGLIALFDLRKSDLFSSVNNYFSKVKPVGIIKNIRWLKKKYAMGKEMEVLLSVSMDGTMCCWTHGRILDGHIMRHIKRGSKITEKEQKMVVAIDTAGMCMQINPDNSETFIIGTIEGQVLQAEINDPDSYTFIYYCHNGPVYDLQWSPLVTDVFMTCGTDRFVHIWQNGKKNPSKSLSLEEIVLRVAWSCVKSTLFAAMCEKRVLFFDLSLNLHKQIAEFTSEGHVTFTYIKFCPRNNWFLVGQSDGTTELRELVNIPFLNIDQAEGLRDTFLSDY